MTEIGPDAHVLRLDRVSQPARRLVFRPLDHHSARFRCVYEVWHDWG